jgi:hypothetical protein
MTVSPNPALPIWPYGKFGAPLLDPDTGLVDPVVRTEMDFGVKARQRFINPLGTGTYQVLLTNDQYLYFQSWHKHKIDNGAGYFNFKVRTGDDLSWEEVAMTGMYTAQGQSNRFVTVTFSLLLRTNSVPSEAALDSWLGE